MMINIVLLLLSSISLIIFGIYIYLRWHFNYWRNCRVVGPQPQLFYGTFPKTSAGYCNRIEELHDIYLQYKNTQRFVGVFAARKPILFILDPKLATTILTKYFKYFHDNESSKWTTSNVEKLRFYSPFVATGAEWKERRTELTPILAANRLRNFYAPARSYASKCCVEILANLNTPIDVKMLANRFTSMFMSNFIWSIDDANINANENNMSKSPTANVFLSSGNRSITANKIEQMAKSMITQSFSCVRYFSHTANWPWLRKLKPVRFFSLKTEQFFRQLATDVVNERLNANTVTNATSLTTTLSVKQRNDGGQNIDVIQHLLQLSAKKCLNDLQIAGHTTTTLIDGYETAANLIAHCLLLLSRNLRAQQKLRKELQKFMEENDDDTLNNYNALDALTYLDYCLLETLRIFPPLPSLFKICTASINLENNNDSKCTILNLKPNDMVYISTYSFQRDADYFENPDEFWPERFDEANDGGARKYREMGVFLPFGDGPRMCPGMKLGLMEAKIIVAEIVRNFALICDPNTRKDNKIAANSFLLTIDGAMNVIFKKLT